VKKFDVSNVILKNFKDSLTIVPYNFKLSKPVFTIRNSENGPEQLSVGWKANKFGNNMIIAIKNNAERYKAYITNGGGLSPSLM
jgi:hypothetical protein